MNPEPLAIVFVSLAADRRAQATERRKSPPKPGVRISLIAFSGEVLST